MPSRSSRRSPGRALGRADGEAASGLLTAPAHQSQVIAACNLHGGQEIKKVTLRPGARWESPAVFRAPSPPADLPGPGEQRTVLWQANKDRGLPGT